MRTLETAFLTRCLVALLALASQPAPSRAQGNAAPTIGRSQLLARFRDQVRAAEAEGARRPQATTVASATPRRCVDASGEAEARSGDFVAGSFRLYPAIWYQGTGKLWWRPTTVVAGETLLVRAKALDESHGIHEYRLTTIAQSRPVGGQFYPSDIRVPHAGPWLLIATVGRNWGCFLLRV